MPQREFWKDSLAVTPFAPFLTIFLGHRKNPGANPFSPYGQSNFSAFPVSFRTAQNIVSSTDLLWKGTACTNCITGKTLSSMPQKSERLQRYRVLQSYPSHFLFRFWGNALPDSSTSISAPLQDQGRLLLRLCHSILRKNYIQAHPKFN